MTGMGVALAVMFFVLGFTEITVLNPNRVLLRNMIVNRVKSRLYHFRCDGRNGSCIGRGVLCIRCGRNVSL